MENVYFVNEKKEMVIPPALNGDYKGRIFVISEMENSFPIFDFKAELNPTKIEIKNTEINCVLISGTRVSFSIEKLSKCYFTYWEAVSTGTIPLNNVEFSLIGKELFIKAKRHLTNESIEFFVKEINGPFATDMISSIKYILLPLLSFSHLQ